MAESYQTNILNVASHYIKKLKVPVSVCSLKQYIEENPYYPTLYAISNVFDRFRIPHEAFTINKENFEQLTPPFIAYLKNLPTGKDFVLVTSTKVNEVFYIAEGRKEKRITKEKFLVDFENIILQAGPDDKSGEKDYGINCKKELIKNNKTKLLISVSALIFLSTIYFFLHSLPSAFIMSTTALLVIKTGGLATTILLLIYEIDRSNTFVKSICTAGKQTNCGAVLQSRAAKIFGMSWSEAGFFYFAATFLFLLFPSILYSGKIAVLSVASCLATPYIVFSIYYQWKVVKQWCPLCLSVQAVLALELIWSLVNFWQRPVLSNVSLPVAFLPVLYCILLPIIGWYIAKPLLLRAKDESVYKAAYKRLLYNPDNFNSLLQQQPTAPDGYQHIGIEIGNPNAETTIIKVCNPYCGPCAKAHPVLEDIIHRNNNIKLKVIFTATNEPNDKRGIAAKHLLAIAAKQNPAQTAQALGDWYLAEKKDYDVFANKYPLNGELKQQERHIEMMKTWCDEAGITHTPTIFINSYKMPDAYSIEELKYIL
jgi:uncharacterized membrane protein